MSRTTTASIILQAIWHKGEDHAYVKGWIACASLAGWITLAERQAAELAIEHKPIPTHVGEWWKQYLYAGKD